MEVEEYLGRSRLYRRLRRGPHGQFVERYAARLVEERLVRHGTWRCLNVVGGLLSTGSELSARMGFQISLGDGDCCSGISRHRDCHSSLQAGGRGAWAAAGL